MQDFTINIVSETVPQISPALRVSVDERDQADVTCTPRQMDNNKFKYVKLLMPTTFNINNAENTISMTEMFNHHHQQQQHHHHCHR